VTMLLYLAQVAQCVVTAPRDTTFRVVSQIGRKLKKSNVWRGTLEVGHHHHGVVS
jgi:hypothetical protein